MPKPCAFCKLPNPPGPKVPQVDWDGDGRPTANMLREDSRLALLAFTTAANKVHGDSATVLRQSASC